VMSTASTPQAAAPVRRRLRQCSRRSSGRHPAERQDESRCRRKQRQRGEQCGREHRIGEAQVGHRLGHPVQRGAMQHGARRGGRPADWRALPPRATCQATTTSNATTTSPARIIAACRCRSTHAGNSAGSDCG
jgi:hypothetical protein